jgi:group I intron endonuclease
VAKHKNHSTNTTENHATIVVKAKFKMIGIYKISSPSNRIYVGQSINIDNRWKYYKRVSKFHIGPKLYNSLKKHGFENHKFEVIEECNLEQLNERETFYKQQIINELGWDKALFCELYDKGGGPRNETTKRKISLSNKGKKFNDEHKFKLSKAKKNKKRSEEVKIKLTKAKTPQHIYNISKGKLGKPNILSRKPILQFDLQGNFIKEYDSYTSAKNTTKINGINNAVKGTVKTAGGYLWTYKTN